MRIYSVLELYPSPYKPYFDTQFVDLLNEGHDLKVFSVRQQGRDVPDKAQKYGLDALTRHYPATLKHLPRQAGSMFWNLLCHPVVRTRCVLRVVDPTCGLRANILNVGRAILLPIEPPDIFLVHNLATATQFPFAKRIYESAKIVLYYHGGEICGVPMLDEQEARKAFQCADIVLTNTSNSRNHAINRGAPADKVKINPVGFDLEEFQPVKRRVYRSSGLLRLISIGRLSREKGLVYVLIAIRELVKKGTKNIRYTVVGDGPELAQLRAFVDENHINEFVQFPGYEGSRKRLYKKISDSDALVLPSIATESWEETQGCVLQEAMLLETPVLTSTTGGIPESIAPEMTPFSFPPEDPAAIAECVERFLALPTEEIERLGKNCRAHAAQKYSITRLNQNILDLA